MFRVTNITEETQMRSEIAVWKPVVWEVRRSAVTVIKRGFKAEYSAVPNSRLCREPWQGVLPKLCLIGLNHLPCERNNLVYSLCAFKIQIITVSATNCIITIQRKKYCSGRSKQVCELSGLGVKMQTMKYALGREGSEPEESTNAQGR